MPRDTTNLPFHRPTPHYNDDSNNKLIGTLNIESILIEEFNYASVTAYQAVEDRARYTNFFFLTLGIVVSALGAISQIGGGTRSNSLPVVTILLLGVSILNINFFVGYVRTRQAYKESLICMTTIKEFYIRKFERQMPEIKYAFRWRFATMAKGERIGSLTFMSSALSVFLGSLCLAGAVFIFTEQPFSASVAYILALAIFFIAVSVHIFYYREALSGLTDMKIIQQQERELARLSSSLIFEGGDM
jgi:hypothetical protein